MDDCDQWLSRSLENRTLSKCKTGEWPEICYAHLYFRQVLSDVQSAEQTIFLKCLFLSRILIDLLGLILVGGEIVYQATCYTEVF